MKWKVERVHVFPAEFVTPNRECRTKRPIKKRVPHQSHWSIRSIHPIVNEYSCV